MNIPEMQIERISYLTDSIICTLKARGYTVSDIKTDPETADSSINIYYFGNIVKRIIFEKDLRVIKK